MASKRPVFLYDECIACGICAQSCPVSAISLLKTDIDEYKKAYPQLNERPCTGCGQCETACPMAAVTMDGPE